MRGNPFGEELMILNPAGDELELLGNPTRKRRKGRKHRKGAHRRFKIRIPKRRRSRRRSMTLASNPVHHRRHGQKHRKSSRRYRRNPVGNGGGFSIKKLPGLAVSGILGALAGGAGFYASKKILPVEHDRAVTGYAVHGLAGTAIAILGSGLIRGVTKIQLPVGVMLTGVWTTVGWRVLMNHVFNKIARPAALAPATAAATVKGLGGIESALPLGYDVSTADEEMSQLAAVGQQFLAQGQEYVSPEPYDMGRMSQQYQPARALPAASMPVNGVGDQQYISPEPYDMGYQESPEMGKWSKRPTNWVSPIW